MALFWILHASVLPVLGKMYRVRLDSVIYVLDADDISAKLDAQDADAVAVTNQLRCADVVLLNKVDLIEPEQLAAVRAKYVGCDLAWLHDQARARTPPGRGRGRGREGARIVYICVRVENRSTVP